MVRAFKASQAMSRAGRNTCRGEIPVELYRQPSDFLINYKGACFLKQNLIPYSMQIAMLKQLLTRKLITEKEYYMVKNKLMKEYGIISDITG